MFLEDITRIIHRRVGEGPVAQKLIEDFQTKLRVPGDAETDTRIEVVFSDDEADR
jgi:hypothetical protein